MRRFIFAFLFSACATEHADDSVFLHGAEMDFDMTARPGFTIKPPYIRAGDTAVFHDYFTLQHQPIYNVKANLSGDTLYFEYRPKGDASNDWSPPVAVEIRMRLDIVGDSLWVRFPIVTEARTPFVTEPGFRDASKPLLVRIGL